MIFNWEKILIISESYDIILRKNIINRNLSNICNYLGF